MSKWPRWAMMASCLAWHPGVWAWGSLLLIDVPPQASTLAVGAQFVSTPRSLGTSSSDRTWLPAVDYYNANGLFASTESGIGVNLSHDEKWAAGLRLWPQFGHEAQPGAEQPTRIGTRIQAQGFGNVTLLPALLLQSAISAGSGFDHKGLQTEWGLTSGVPIGSDLLGLGLSATWANRAYRQSYVAPLPAGWADWSWTASLQHQLTHHSHLDLQWQSARLLHGTDGNALTWHRQQGAMLAVLFDL